jgi:hypothetical protein
MNIQIHNRTIIEMIMQESDPEKVKALALRLITTGEIK